VLSKLETTSSTATPRTLEKDTLVGPYRIEEQLDSGGMGVVYRAFDTRLGRTVAIKVGFEQFSDRFYREARAIASLNHPNICTLHDIVRQQKYRHFSSWNSLKGTHSRVDFKKDFCRSTKLCRSQK
jgi:serine/threonine protein kinase